MAEPDLWTGGHELLISGARVVTPSGTRPLNIVVQDGMVRALLPPAERPPAQCNVEAEGLTALPGFFDMHVHFREPGQTHKEDFSTGTAAAAVGGFTAVAEMPNSVPPTTTAARLDDKRLLAEGRVHVDFALWGGAGSAEHVRALAEAGAVGIKVYLGLESDAHRHSDAPAELAVQDDAAFYRILEAAGEVGMVVAAHCGNRALQALWRDRWRGRSFPELKGEIEREPQLHKFEAVARTLLLAMDVGTRVHIVHLPAPAIPLVRRAKDAGARVTAEAALPFMTHDLLDTAAGLGFDRYRSVSDAEALWAAARDGTVDVLATDHAPHTLEEKRQAQHDLLAAPSGYPELDTALPMLLDAVNRGLLSLERLAELMGSGPRQILGTGGSGTIEAGNRADLVLVDLHRSATIDAGRLHTKARWSPFEGREVRGWPVATYLRGELIAADGQLVQVPPRGRFLAGAASAVR